MKQVKIRNSETWFSTGNFFSVTLSYTAGICNVI